MHSSIEKVRRYTAVLMTALVALASGCSNQQIEDNDTFWNDLKVMAFEIDPVDSLHSGAGGACR